MQIQKSYEINKNIIVTHKMAKKEETRTSIDELNESLSSIEQKVENNKNYIYWVCGAIVVIAAAIVGYIYGIRNPGLEGAQSEISQADMQLAQGNDSIALAQYMAVADGYSNSVANRANLNAAILLYNDGKYDEAIGYISNFDPEGVIIGPASQSLLGDCYVNTGKLEEALAAYDKAIALSADNSYYTPLDEDRLYRFRWIGFVNVVTDHKGNIRHGAVNRGRTASEVRDYWAWHEHTDFPERALPFKVWRAWRKKSSRVSCANAVEVSGLYPKLECPF